jgi:DUF1680 family protein
VERLLLATGAHRYADELERVLYNAIAVATGVDGRHFFYSNPLHLRTGHDGSSEDAPSQRLSWYSCACCPPNLARLVASLHSYLATTDDSGIQLHLYADARITDGDRRIEVATRYPWEETVTATVSGGDAPWTLALRVPGWCAQSSLSIDGVVEQVPVVDGYLRLTRRWTGQRVELRLDMPPRLVAAHPRVDAVRGCLALTRGPLVFCLEQADLPAGTVLEDVALDPAVAPVPGRRPDDDLVPVALTLAGRVTPAGSGPLYAPLGGPARPAQPVELTAVPYFLWGNRDPGAMRVWIPVAG